MHNYQLAADAKEEEVVRQRKAVSRLGIQKFIINNIQKCFIPCKVLNRTSWSCLQGLSVYYQAFSFLLAHKHLQLMQILASISHNSTFISLQSHTNILSKPHKYAGSDLTSFCWLLWPRDKSLKCIPERWATAVDILNLSAQEGIYILLFTLHAESDTKTLKI